MTEPESIYLRIADEGLLRDTAAGVTQALAGVLEGASEDLAAFTHAATKLMLYAAATGDEETAASVRRSITLMGEVQRLRASEAAWSVAFGILEGAAGVVVQLLLSARIPLTLPTND